MKMLVYTLLITVVFLTGIILGTTNKNFSVHAPERQEVVSDEARQENLSIVNEKKEEELNVDQRTATMVQQPVENKPVFEKAALIIEETSVWVYDQVIQVAYYISEIFI
ncbi:hypothetical protein [Paraliobacillus salinarum]|uniref:hypothetical protein n=1 Tax=Paraliobacillus salinarum TaxID=1158996 RepID=UPI0015F56F2F|nr:hypothetical protein [Paraliobacillus salinarum]